MLAPVKIAERVRGYASKAERAQVAKRAVVAANKLRELVKYLVASE